MNGYLLGVIGTVLVCSLLTAIAPEGKTSSVIKGVARLACVLAIIAPVLRFFKTGELGEFDENRDNFFTESVIGKENSFIQYYSEKRIEDAERALAAEIAEKYATSVEVSLQWSYEEESFGGVYAVENVRIDRIVLDVAEEVDGEVKEEMRLYVREKYGSEVWIA